MSSDSTGGPLSDSVLGDSSTRYESISTLTELRPEQVGPYRIVELIGEGGMGEVYRAERHHPIRQTVAIKIIKLGMNSREVVGRFESERQALALMDHPGIARVLDAGATATGRPYFVMDFVAGKPITQFCDEQNLSIDDRLQLFGQVCDAIGHAHTKAIIHRDIKPSNVLAYLQDGIPTVKVIDFGVAKAITADRLTSITVQTSNGQAIGTYDCMSPEQAEGSGDIDTRTDVYSLGILLYELLIGIKPFDGSNLKNTTDEEIRRIIREVDPPKPSTRLTSLGPSACQMCARRQAKLETLTRRLRNELEWIPLKAIRKERSRRYDSPAQLSQDIQNYLHGRALLAGPESRAYRIRKYLGRHWRLVGIAAAATCIVAGGAAIYVQDIRAERNRTAKALIEAEKQRTLAELQRAEAVRQAELARTRFNDVRQLANKFLFEIDDKIQNLAGATPARALLVKTALEYLNRLSKQAGDDRDLLYEVCIAYQAVGDVQGNPFKPNLGDSAGALGSYQNWQKIAEELVAADPTNVRAMITLAFSHDRIGHLYLASGKIDSALERSRKAIAIFDRIVASFPDNANHLSTLAGLRETLGTTLVEAGDTRGGMESFQASLAIREKLLHDDPTQSFPVVTLLRNLGNLSASLGDSRSALSSLQRAESLTRKQVQTDPDDARATSMLGTVLSDIGDILAAAGDVPAATLRYTEALSISQKLADADPTNASAMMDLTVGYNRIGKLHAAVGETDAAIARFSQSMETARRVLKLNPTNTNARRSITVLYIQTGDAHAAAGDLSAAISCYGLAHTNAVEIASSSPSSATAQRDVLACLGGIADLYEQMGSDEARPRDERIAHWQAARAWYVKQSEQFADMKSRNILSPTDLAETEQISGAPAYCDEQISALVAAAPSR